MADVTLSELERALDELINSLPPDLGPDEITVMMVKARKKSNYETARKLLDLWTEEGKMEYVGKRMSHGHPVDAWKIKKAE